jgi:hypothetical protein
MHSFIALLMAASVSFVAGCGGKSTTPGDDSTAPTPSPSNVRSPTGYLDGLDENGCLADELYCAGGKDVFVGSKASCGENAESCYSRINRCTGQVLWCAHYSAVSCGNVPVCPPGDRQVSGCPDAGVDPNGSGPHCYELADCHTTIWCTTP